MINRASSRTQATTLWATAATVARLYGFGAQMVELAVDRALQMIDNADEPPTLAFYPKEFPFMLSEDD